MDKEALEHLRLLLKDFLEKEGYILVEANFVYEGPRLILRILTDRPEGGINLEECARLNQKIGELLDAGDLIKQRYILEVSSPGLDRPLKTEEDFRRCINREVIVYTHQPIKGKREIQALIKGVKEERLWLEIEGEEFFIPLSEVIKAKQII